MLGDNGRQSSSNLSSQKKIVAPLLGTPGIWSPQTIINSEPQKRLFYDPFFKSRRQISSSGCNFHNEKKRRREEEESVWTRFDEGKVCGRAAWTIAWSHDQPCCIDASSISRSRRDVMTDRPFDHDIICQRLDGDLLASTVGIWQRL